MDTGYVWDEDKYERVRNKHQVFFYEVVSAMEDPRGFETMDESSYNDDQWIWIGKTSEGRVLVVVYNDEDAPLSRIITSFEAEERLKNEYEEG
jgi:uncharacterized DUF497 family protein